MTILWYLVPWFQLRVYDLRLCWWRVWLDRKLVCLFRRAAAPWPRGGRIQDCCPLWLCPIGSKCCAAALSTSSFAREVQLHSGISLIKRSVRSRLFGFRSPTLSSRSVLYTHLANNRLLFFFRLSSTVHKLTLFSFLA